MATGRGGGRERGVEAPGEPARTHQEIEAQHRALSAQLAECRSVLAARPGDGSALELFRDLFESLEAHFVREESLYYPTLWSLRPALEEPLKRVIDSHAQLRQQLAVVSRRIESGDTEAAGRALDRFAGLIAEHEAVEEELLASIE